MEKIFENAISGIIMLLTDRQTVKQDRQTDGRHADISFQFSCLFVVYLIFFWSTILVGGLSWIPSPLKEYRGHAVT